MRVAERHLQVGVAEQLLERLQQAAAHHEPRREVVAAVVEAEVVELRHGGEHDATSSKLQSARGTRVALGLPGVRRPQAANWTPGLWTYSLLCRRWARNCERGELGTAPGPL